MIGHSLTSFIHPADTESVYNQIHHAYKQVAEGKLNLIKYLQHPYIFSHHRSAGIR